MAISASVDSDTCRFAATSANERFSCGVGRAVIDGAVDFEAPSFTARQPVLLQIADTSLSCHHSNNDPTTLLDLNNRLVRFHEFIVPVPSLLGVGLTRVSADSRTRRKARACTNQRPP